MTPSTTTTTTINITEVNDAPVVAAGNTIAYTEQAAAVTLDATLTVSDADNANLVGATISLGGTYVSGDTLHFTNTATITGVWDGLGTLTLSGTDTLAAYQAALRSISFDSSSNDPGPARLVTWTVDDGMTPSTTTTTTINITEVNDAPVVAAGNTIAYTEQAAAVTLDATHSVSDPHNLHPVPTRLSSDRTYVSGDTLHFTNTATITGV